LEPHADAHYERAAVATAECPFQQWRRKVGSLLIVLSQELVTHPGLRRELGGARQPIEPRSHRMDLHDNARTTPFSRALMVDRVTRQQQPCALLPPPSGSA
jgi:hypothetical protein